MLLATAPFSLPFLGFLAALLFYARQSAGLPVWRNALFVFALAANALSAAVLLAFVVHAYIAAHGVTQVDLDRMYPVLSMLTLSMLAALSAWFGKGASRAILAVDGLLTTVLWFLAGLATSP